MQAYRRRDIVFTLLSSGHLRIMCQQHGKLYYLQRKDTGNGSDLRHVVLTSRRLRMWNAIVLHYLNHPALLSVDE